MKTCQERARTVTGQCPGVAGALRPLFQAAQARAASRQDGHRPRAGLREYVHCSALGLPYFESRFELHRKQQQRTTYPGTFPPQVSFDTPGRPLQQVQGTASARAFWSHANIRKGKASVLADDTVWEPGPVPWWPWPGTSSLRGSTVGLQQPGAWGGSWPDAGWLCCLWGMSEPLCAWLPAVSRSTSPAGPVKPLPSVGPGQCFARTSVPSLSTGWLALAGGALCEERWCHQRPGSLICPNGLGNRCSVSGGMWPSSTARRTCKPQHDVSLSLQGTRAGGASTFLSKPWSPQQEKRLTG